MAGALNGLRQRSLMLGAGTGVSPRTNLPRVLNESLQDVCLLVVNDFAWVRAELTGAGSSPE